MRCLWQEDPSSYPALTTLRGQLGTDVCVVGLGGSGLAALSELRRRGVDAIGLDAIGVAAGAAGRNGGFLLAGSAAFYHDAVRELGRSRARSVYTATLEALGDIAAETPAEVRRTGSLRIAADATELEDCRRQLVAMRDDGLAVEEYSGEEGEGLLFPNDAVFHPVRRCRSLAGRLGAWGVPLVQGTVTALEEGRVVCDSGVVTCQSMLVCVDGGVEVLVPELAREARSARLQMAATAPLSAVVATRPVYRRYGWDYYQQLPSGELAVGAARDAGGESEWTSEPATTTEVQGAIDALVASVTGGSGRVTHRWCGIVAFTTSRMPIVRRVRPDLYVAGAYSGTGNVIGWLAARSLVEMLLEGSSELAQLLDGRG